MVGRARLKHAQMRLRANVQIDYELRRLADVEMHRRGRGANQKRNLHLSASLLGESTSSQVRGPFELCAVRCAVPCPPHRRRRLCFGPQDLRGYVPSCLE